MDEDKRLISAVDYYFIQEDGSRFKVSMLGIVLNFSSSLCTEPVTYLLGVLIGERPSAKKGSI